MDWPVEVPEMRSTFCSFYSACDGAARTLYRCFAKALRVDDEDVWVRKFGNTSHCSMRAMRYPSMRRSERNAASKVEIVGISEHTDFEFFTLLHQTCEGLELKGRDGTWRSAPAYENDAIFTCILSDAFEIFTNGVVRATPHRVRPSRDGRDRLSLVRFNGLNDDAVIAPLPQFVTPDRPLNAAYGPRTQGDHVGENVTRASDNLADMLDKRVYPKSELTRPPKRFAQLLVLDVANGRILLGKHTRGEFAGRYTGFIAEVDSEKDLVPLGRRSVRRARESRSRPLGVRCFERSERSFRSRALRIPRLDARRWSRRRARIRVRVSRRLAPSRSCFQLTRARQLMASFRRGFENKKYRMQICLKTTRYGIPSCWDAFRNATGSTNRSSLGISNFSGDEGELTDHAVREVEFRHSSFNRSSTARVLARLERITKR